MSEKEAILLNGKLLSEEIEKKVAQEVNQLDGRPPTLAVIIVGSNPASQIYVKRKAEACKRASIHSRVLEFSDQIAESDLLEEIHKLNRANEVDGILIQLPLPRHIDSESIILAIDPKKDVDGFHPINLGSLLLGQNRGFTSCTPLGIKMLLAHYGIDLAGKHAVILGRSNIVGKPLAALLMQNEKGMNATVTIANSYTQNLPRLVKEADLLVAAMGSPHFVKADWIKPGAIVVDVGISRVNGKLLGDVDPLAINQASYMTPVPGGVGPMTISALICNTLKSRKSR